VLYFVVHTRGQHLQIGEGFHECRVRFPVFLRYRLVGKEHSCAWSQVPLCTEKKNYARFHSEKL